MTSSKKKGDFMTRIILKPSRTSGLKKEVNTNIYYIDLNLKGFSRIRKSTGTRDYHEALEILEQVLKEAKTQKDKENIEISLHDAIDKYLFWSKNIIKINDKSYKSRKNRLDKLKNFFDDMPISEFNLEHYENWLLHRRRTRVANSNKLISDATINSDIGDHKHFFRYCMERPSRKKPYLFDNPIESVKLKPIEYRSKKAYPEQVVFNYLVFVKEHNERLFQYSFVAYTLGLRRSEVLRIRRDDMYLDSTEPYIILRNTKGKRERRVPVPTSTVKLIKGLKRFPSSFFVNKGIKNQERKIDNSNDLLFPELLKDTVSQQTKRYADKFARVIGLDPKDFHLRLHGLRHSFATGLSEDGIPVKKIKDLLGHKRESTTEIYLGLHDADKNKAVEKFNDLKYLNIIES